MSGTIPVKIDAIDELHQIRDELMVVWYALGNTVDLDQDGFLIPVREHVNGLHNRIVQVCSAIGEVRQ